MSGYVLHTSEMTDTALLPINHTNRSTTSVQAENGGASGPGVQHLLREALPSRPAHTPTPEKSGSTHTRPAGPGQWPAVPFAAPRGWKQIIFRSESKPVMTDGIHLGTLGVSQARVLDG